jgi:hypothetical protein
VENCFITEAVEALGYDVDKTGGRVVGAVNAVGKATSELLGVPSQFMENE